MKLMVVGSGGREHAIIKKLKENKKVEKIYAVPGNGGMAEDAELVYLRQRTAKCQPWDDEQHATNGETITRTYEHIHTAAQPTGHQTGECGAKGVEDNHAVAQPCKLTTFGSAKIQSQDSAEPYYTADDLARSHFVALEAGASQQHHEERAQRVEDSRPRPFAVGHADVEEEIVERGIH